MWTQFWDMHSGGGLKEPQQFIYIEAPEEEAKVIFFNRFGHNPERVTCTCCGEDYFVTEGESLAQMTAYHRHCRFANVPRDPETGRYPEDSKSVCMEDGEPIPQGMVVERESSMKYVPLEAYLAREDVLVIRDSEITPKERIGGVPAQGYVWVG